MKNKKAIIGLGAIATLLFGVASSIAYLTDTDTTVNVMTVGNVKIAQHEYERVLDENGKYTNELQPYSQLKPIVPAVYKTSDKTEDWADEYQTWESVGAPGSNQLFHEGVKNVIDKFVFVENTGRKDAYYRTIIAIEEPEGLSGDLIHINVNSNSRFDYNAEDEGVQGVSKSNPIYTTINGTRFIVYTITYTDVLAPREVSRPSLLQVYLDPAATNEDIEKFGNTFEILALSQAVQTDGFDNSNEALEEAFGKVTEEKAQEWFGSTNICRPTLVSTPEELINGLSSSCEVILNNDIELTESTYMVGNYPSAMHIDKEVILNLNGHKLEIDGAKLAFAFVIDNGANLTITGNGTVYCDRLSMAVVGGNSTLTIENGKFIHPNSTGLFIEATPNYSEFYKEIPATVNIYGGTFDCGANPRYLLNEQAAYAHQSINVYGGTFKNFDPSNGNDGSYLADGYKVIEDNGTYTVVSE